MDNSVEFNANYLVCVRCSTFNHAPFIEDAMNGFCIQQTNFPFVCTIIDDASTDEEQEVIRNYLQEHFDLEDKSVVRNEETEDYIYCYARHKTNHCCYFAVYFLKYNHYSIKKPKAPYIKEWNLPINYIAICEGDDYWIDPLKLQKQVGFMELHPNCTMTCSRTKLFSENRQKYFGETFCYEIDRDVDIKDVIYRTGLFISTPSIIFRSVLRNNYPEYCRKCAVGDYPLQIYAALQGKVRYFNESLAVYRTENSQSWMGKQDWLSVSDARLKVLQSEVNMMKGFANDYPQYRDLFENKIAEFINEGIPTWRSSRKDRKKYMDFFASDIKNYSWRWKIDKMIRLTRIPRLRRYYERYILKDFNYHKISY